MLNKRELTVLQLTCELEIERIEKFLESEPVAESYRLPAIAHTAVLRTIISKLQTMKANTRETP